MTSFTLLSVDEEIHFATYPFEIQFQSHRYSGWIESQGTSTIIKWTNKPPLALQEVDPDVILSAGIKLLEKSRRELARQDLLEELLDARDSSQ